MNDLIQWIYTAPADRFVCGLCIGFLLLALACLLLLMLYDCARSTFR